MQESTDVVESGRPVRCAWLRMLLGGDCSRCTAASPLNIQPVTSYFRVPRVFTRLIVRGCCFFYRPFTAFTERFREKFYCWICWFKLQSFRNISHSRLEREGDCVSAPLLPMAGSPLCEVRVHRKRCDVVRISERVAPKMNDWFGEFSIPLCKSRCRNRAPGFLIASWVFCGELMASTWAFCGLQPR